MPIEMPEPPIIDRTRAGWLRISAEMVGNLLRLPAGCVCAEVRSNSDGTALDALIEGALMPHRHEGPDSTAPDVMLIVQVSQDEGQRTVELYFAHAPETIWKLSGPDPVPEPT